MSELFVADAQYNRVVSIVIGLALARDSDGRAKFVRAGSFWLGDALDQYGESRRRAIVQLSPPRVVGRGGPRTARQSGRLGERYGRNRCKVNDGSISLQRMPSRTLVTHQITRAIQPRTRARSSGDRRLASPSPIVTIPNAWFRRKVRHVWAADSPAVACNGTLWLVRHRIQVSRVRHEFVVRPIRNSLGSSGQ